MMKFLCDVHISYKMVRYLESLGYEAIHINEILEKSNTKDSDICSYADKNDMIVLTKDADFRDSHFIKKTLIGSVCNRVEYTLSAYSKFAR